jgi:hypothetical protein
VLKDIAGQTSGFMPRDIRAIIADAGACLVSRIMEKDKENELNEDTRSVDVRPNAMDNRNEYTSTEVHSLCKEDLEKALDRMKKRTASALGTPKVRRQTQLSWKRHRLHSLILNVNRIMGKCSLENLLVKKECHILKYGLLVCMDWIHVNLSDQE